MLQLNVLDFPHFQLLFIQETKMESDICKRIYWENVDFHIFGDACKTGIQVDDFGSILSGADDCVYEHYLKNCFLDVCYKGLFLSIIKKSSTYSDSEIMTTGDSQLFQISGVS